MKKISRLLFVLSFVMVLVYFLPSPSEAQIYDKVLRLHVLANSDSPKDQSLKLMVRDEILEYSKTLGEFEGVESAEETYSHELEKIKEIAKEVIISQGYDYPVDVSLGYEYYPTRQYEDVSLPAGEYLSLKVMIGGAAGQNWWCVLYPPLCISAASADEELIDAGFTPEQMQIITDGESTRYKVKFKILESAKKLWNLLKK
jgi:stage II sporulation protein R